MDSLRALVAQFGEAWRRLGMGQRMAILAVGLLAASAAVTLVMWARRPDFVPLYSRLNAEDASSVTEYLKSEKVPYRLERGGSTVEVPSAKLYTLRMELAAKGVVKSGHLGFELFDRTHVGMTDFVQRTNYRRALEGELARTIETLDHVTSARVHIVLPEERLFASEEREATASILLGLDPGYTLERDEVGGIVQLVAGSVEGLRASSVTVLQTDGRTLTLPAGDDSNPAALTSRQLEARRSLEGYLTTKAQSLLDTMLGPGESVVRVDADIDFEQVERSQESYDPNSRVLRSESRRASEGGEGSATEENTTSNYELSKSVEHILGTGQTLKRLSVAVVVDGSYKEQKGADGKPSRVFQPRSQDELANLTRLVKNAVGLQENRGDVIEVSCVALSREEPPPKPTVVATGVDAARRYAPQFLPLVGLVVLALLIRRSLSSLARTVPGETRTGLRGVGVEIPGAMVETEEDHQRRLVRERVEALAREKPEVAAQLIRSWLLEKR